MLSLVIIILSFLSLALMAPPRLLLDFITSKTDVIFRFPSPRKTSVLEKQKVYLTVDDSPSAYTYLILDALRDCDNGKALFFVIGDYAKQYPDVLRALANTAGAAGVVSHDVGNHDLADRLTASPWRTSAEIKKDLLDCEIIIKTILNIDSGLRWLRPGSGLVTPSLHQASKELGYKILLGDTYGHDCHLGFLGSWFLSKFYEWRITPGSVIILHDGTKERATNTAAVIRHLYATKNISFASLPLLPSPG